VLAADAPFQHQVHESLLKHPYGTQVKEGSLVVMWDQRRQAAEAGIWKRGSWRKRVMRKHSSSGQRAEALAVLCFWEDVRIGAAALARVRRAAAACLNLSSLEMARRHEAKP